MVESSSKSLIQTREEPRAKRVEPRFFLLWSFDQDFDSRLNLVFFTFRCSLWWHFRCRWKLRLKLEDLTFSQNLSIEDCGLRFLERFFTQMTIFFLKLGCKRHVLSELRIQTTLIFSLSFDKVFYFCVPLSIRWWNQHWVEKQHHFVVVQERTFWREKTASTFWREKWLFLFSGFKAKAFAVLPIFFFFFKGQNRWPVQIYSQKDESFLRPLRNTFTRCLTLIPSDKNWHKSTVGNQNNRFPRVVQNSRELLLSTD